MIDQCEITAQRAIGGRDCVTSYVHFMGRKRFIEAKEKEGNARSDGDGRCYDGKWLGVVLTCYLLIISFT